MRAAPINSRSALRPARAAGRSLPGRVAPLNRPLPATVLGDNINPTRNLEREGLIGYSHVFLQVAERESRRAPLSVCRNQATEHKRPRIDDENQPIVIRL